MLNGACRIESIIRKYCLILKYDLNYIDLLELVRLTETFVSLKRHYYNMRDNVIVKNNCILVDRIRGMEKNMGGLFYH